MNLRKRLGCNLCCHHFFWEPLSRYKKIKIFDDCVSCAGGGERFIKERDSCASLGTVASHSLYRVASSSSPSSSPSEFTCRAEILGVTTAPVAPLTSLRNVGVRSTLAMLRWKLATCPAIDRTTSEILRSRSRGERLPHSCGDKKATDSSTALLATARKRLLQLLLAPHGQEGAAQLVVCHGRHALFRLLAEDGFPQVSRLRHESLPTDGVGL